MGITMSKRPTVCGVQVRTWGTRYRGGVGLRTYLTKLLYGGNHGHAAITLTIPATEEGLKLIDKYCFNEEMERVIPFDWGVISSADGMDEDVYTISAIPSFQT